MRKFAKIASVLLHGVRNGKKSGKRFCIVQKNVKIVDNKSINIYQKFNLRGARVGL
jgi:hypothetical protein